MGTSRVVPILRPLRASMTPIRSLENPPVRSPRGRVRPSRDGLFSLPSILFGVGFLGLCGFGLADEIERVPFVEHEGFQQVMVDL